MTFDNLQSLGMGIIGFAIIIGVGAVVLYKFGGAVANCYDIFSTTYSWNSSTNLCMNNTNITDGNYTPANSAFTNMGYMQTQLGQTGLAGWTPAVIAISVGMLFLGYFMVRGKGKTYR